MFELDCKFGKLHIFDAAQAQPITSGTKFEKNRTFHFVNAHVLSEAVKDRDYFNILAEGYCFCDSRPLELYSRLVNRPITQLRGSDFLKMNLPRASTGKQLIIGGFKGSERNLLERLQNIFDKKLDIVFHQPAFSTDVSVLFQSSLRAASGSGAEAVWLGVGTPKQDILASKLQSLVNANIYCVGAAIAFLVGDDSESPRWVQKLGMEWLFRFAKEPRRLWKRYFFGNATFILILIKDLISRFSFERKSYS